MPTTEPNVANIYASPVEIYSAAKAQRCRSPQ
jgi:hypothetical protein